MLVAHGAHGKQLAGWDANHHSIPSKFQPNGFGNNWNAFKK